MISYRDESPGDVAGREALLDSAFGPARHRKTSERLRRGRLPADGLALVAEDATRRLVGTVRLWHVEAASNHAMLLLGPLAVDAAVRNEGVGAGLMRRAIARAVELGHKAVILVGDAPYYARFGFDHVPVAAIALPGPVDIHRVLGLELAPGALAGAAGLIRATGAKSRRPTRQVVSTPLAA